MGLPICILFNPRFFTDKRHLTEEKRVVNDNLDEKEFKKLLTDYFIHCNRLLKDNAFWLFFTYIRKFLY